MLNILFDQKLVFGLLGGLGLFLFGMKIMSEGLQKIAGDRMRKILAALTNNRFIGTLVGIAVTAIIQSSSATTVMVVGFVNAGLMSLVQSIGVVLGANIGTTVTAVLGAIGATANARRAAAAHVIFNLLAGATAFALLPWLPTGLAALRGAFGLAAAPAADLALFHTSFNLLGLVLVLPVASALAAWLQRRFRTAEEDEARPRYIDRTVLAVPELALSALDRELRRQGDFAARAVVAAIAQPAAERGELALARVVTARLQRAVGDFLAQLTHSGVSPDTAVQMPRLLRIARYYEETAAAASVSATTAVQSGARPSLPSLDALLTAAAAVTDVANPVQNLASTPDIDRAADAFERAYQAAKADLLEAGARSELPVGTVDGWLRAISALRRAVEQLVKAGRMLGTQPTAPV